MLSKSRLFHILWFISEPLLRMLSGVFVGLYAARYMGPERYGEYALVVAICAIALVIGRVGLDAILVRELIGKSNFFRQKMLSTAFSIMFIAGFVCYSSVLVVSYHYLGGGSLIESAAYATIIFFQPFCVYEINGQANERIKPFTLIRLGCLMVGVLMILSAIFYKGPIIIFFVIPVIEKFLQAIAYYLHNRCRGGIDFVVPEWNDYKRLLAQGLPFLLSSLVYTAQTKIDQLIVGATMSVRDVGVYAIASRLYEAWSILPYLVAVALLPMMIKRKVDVGDVIFQQLITKLMRAFFWGFLVLSLIGASLTPAFISIFLDERYAEAVGPLRVMLLSTPFVAMGTLGIRYLIVMGLESVVFYRSIFSCVLVAILAWVLIPMLGLMGGGISILISTVVANLLVDFFDARTRPLAWIKMHSFLPVIRWRGV